ncbi:MAG TPA: hypothetical protein V6D17_00520 [Candidatus Obscuribacterales bacterium]
MKNNGILLTALSALIARGFSFGERGRSLSSMITLGLAAMRLATLGAGLRIIARRVIVRGTYTRFVMVRGTRTHFTTVLGTT